MAYSLKLTNEAKNDFRDMFNYYLSEVEDEEYTRVIINDIRQKVEELRVFPNRCPMLNPEDKTIRALYYKRYAITYEVTEDAVIILNVKHTSRS